MKSRCFILGGGPSLYGFNFKRIRFENVIAVNNSIFGCPEAKWFITKDYTWVLKNGIDGNDKSCEEKRRLFSIGTKAEKMFSVGLRGDRLKRVDRDTCIDLKFNLKYDLSIFDRVIYTKKDDGIGLTFDDFRNGGDSGYAGLQLAVVLGFDEIYLLGYDMMIAGGKTHWHAGYKKFQGNPLGYMRNLNSFLAHYPRAFREIEEKSGSKVFSCSEISRLNEFIPYRNIEEVL